MAPTVGLSSLSGCGDSTSTANAPASSNRSLLGEYTGLMAGNGGTQGKLDLTIVDDSASASPSSLRPAALPAGTYGVRGTIVVNVPGIGSLALSGTVDAQTGNATFTATGGGGTFSVKGTFENGVFVGDLTAPPPMRGGPVRLTKREAGVRVFCGTFRGGLRGAFSLFTTPALGLAGGVFAATTGEQGVLEGTLDGANHLTLKIPPGGSASADIAGAEVVNGSWRLEANSGTFIASESRCASLLPPGTVEGDADAGAVDGGGSDAAVDLDSGTDSGDATLTDAGATDASAEGGGLDGAVVDAGSDGASDGGPPSGPPAAVLLGSANAGTVNVLRLAQGKLYWPSEASDIFSMNVDGSSPATVTTGVTSGRYYKDVAIFSGRALFTEFVNAGGATSNVRYAALPTGTSTALTGPFTIGGAMVGDGIYAYVAEKAATARIVRVDPTGTVADSFVVTGQAYVGDVEVDATHLYWFSGDGAYEIRRKKKDGTGAVETVVAAAAFGPTETPSKLAIDGTHVYVAVVNFADTTKGRIARAPKAPASTLVTLAADQYVQDVQTDGRHVYWSGEDYIRRAPVRGGPWLTVATVPYGAQALAVDTTHAYVASVGSIYRARKSSPIVVADTGNSRLQLSDDDGVTWSTVGSLGTAFGEFNAPRAAVRSHDGKSLWVADTANNRIMRRTNGTWAILLGPGTQVGQVTAPEGLAYDDATDTLYVSDTGNSRVYEVQSASGAGVSAVLGAATSGAAVGKVNAPRGLAVGIDGRVYLADTGNNRVQVYTAMPSGWALVAGAGAGTGLMNAPRGLSIGVDDDLLVADTGNNRVQARASGVWSVFAASGAAAGQVSGPAGVTLTPNDNVFIGDTTNNRVQRITRAGANATVVGVSGTAAGQFSGPSQVN